MDGWTGATGKARDLVEGAPSSTPFTSPPRLLTRKSPLPAQDDPLRPEIAQIMGEARSRVEREVQADPATSSDSEGGIRFLALGRRSGRGSSGIVVLLATYAPEPQEAARCSEAVRYLCAAPATIAAMGGDMGDGKDPQLRLSVHVEGVGTISIECGGPGGGAPPLVHVAVTAPWLGLGLGLG